MTATAQRYWIDITSPHGTSSLEIVPGIYILGRKSGVDIVLADDMVSREHARIECLGEACTITDLNSSNGTKVSGEWLIPEEAKALAVGDVIEIDPFRLEFKATTISLTSEFPVEPPTIMPEPEPESVPPLPLPDTTAEVEVIDKAVAVKAPSGAAQKPVVKREMVPVEPPAPPPAPPKPPLNGSHSEMSIYQPPPGLTATHSHYLQFLPDIYHNDFMTRFLALFESIYRPIEWTVDHFDQFMHPQTAPAGFLPWLASWFDLLLDSSWEEPQKRQLLSEAYQIYSQRGTKTAISRMLEIYTGQRPQIDDQSEGLPPFFFTVSFPTEAKSRQVLIQELLNKHKPAHTNYSLTFAENA